MDKNILVKKEKNEFLKEGHISKEYKGYIMDWNEDELNLEDGMTGLTIDVLDSEGNSVGKSFPNYKEARKWIDDTVDKEYVVLDDYEVSGDESAEQLSDIEIMPKGKVTKSQWKDFLSKAKWSYWLSWEALVNEVNHKDESLKESKEEDSLETFEDKMNFLAKDEQEAIDGYDKILELLDPEADAHVIEQLNKIRTEEIAHKEFLEKVQEDHDLVYTEPLDAEETLPEVDVDSEEVVIDSLKEERDSIWNKGSEITNEDLKRLVQIKKQMKENFYTDSLTKESLKKMKESKADLYIYQFPSTMTKADLGKLAKYNLECLGKVGENGFQPGDYAVQGTLKNLRRYCKDYLDYEMHRDYLYKAKDFDTDVLK